ncbi:MAG: alpha/beta fold hydrolase [Polyangiaceae bacterium]|nr:alpha/beta fold hydrolase [Polyangiaceae bacterium]
MRFVTILAAALAATSAGCLEFHRGPLPGTPADATFADVGGAHVRYVDVGEGEPVVMIHGFASSLNVWDGVREAVAARHRVIALDLKGFGWSDRPEGDYSPRAEAELVLALLAARGVEGRVSVVAHSWGSSVALALALLRPERVKKLALYDAWVYEDQLPTAFLWSRADGMGELIVGAFYDERPDDKMALGFFDRKYVTEALVETVEEQLSRPGTKAAALAAIRGQRFEPMEAEYRRVVAPTLLLWGREDRVTLLEHGERLSLELPNATLRVYPRCGHFPMIEARAASTRELVAFLDAPEPAGPPPAVPAPSAPSAPAQVESPAPVESPGQEPPK